MPDSLGGCERLVVAAGVERELADELPPWRSIQALAGWRAEGFRRGGVLKRSGGHLLAKEEGSIVPASSLRKPTRPRLPFVLALALACLMFAPASALASNSFLGMLHTLSSLGSTVPENGDQNPYGIVTVPRSAGSLVKGDIIISNFNNKENLQGRGTTIVQKSPQGGLSLFAQIEPDELPGPCPGGVGLTTGLAILPDNYVVVGTLPSESGEASTSKPGCLIVLDPYGETRRDDCGPADKRTVGSHRRAGDGRAHRIVRDQRAQQDR
jgi:hypothetical protein